MKKTLLCVAIALLSFSTFAGDVTQDQTKSKGAIRYQGEASIGYMFNLWSMDYNMVEVHTVHGIRVGDYFSAGIGVGVDMVGAEYYSYETQRVQLDITPTMPLYFNVKGYLPVSKGTRLYLSMDAGVVFTFERRYIIGSDGRGVTRCGSGEVSPSCFTYSGAYFNPAFGANIKVSPKSAINLSVGYKTYLSTYGAPTMVSGINVRFGFQF